MPVYALATPSRPAAWWSAPPRGLAPAASPPSVPLPPLSNSISFSSVTAMAPEWSSSSSEPAVERSDSCGYWSSCRVSSHGHHHEAAEDDDPSESEGGGEGAASPRSLAAVSVRRRERIMGRRGGQ
ncbi:hypothetical protein [Oryza sativa Japonica Group]|uniref:Uncharacterized protein n=2 Tax=Oryza TaxID=4527 RepID=Q5ZEA3_ORYSJ|nr:hypothetical protein [Oryza sativa Japonica Group]